MTSEADSQAKKPSKLKRFLQLLDKKMEQSLAMKTGWGRVEVMAAYEKAKTEALTEILDED